MEFIGDSADSAKLNAFPIQNRIDIVSEETGIKTEIFSSTFANRHFVIITQKKKFGTLVRAI